MKTIKIDGKVYKIKVGCFKEQTENENAKYCLELVEAQDDKA